MKKMPQRSREHVIEKESRVHFESILPSQWIFRDKDEDYGIDGEVEIVDEDGAVSGLVFLVQLKGTDQQCIGENRKAVVKVRSCNYWHSLSLPVLLVRYFAKEKVTFRRWADTIDLHYTKDGQESVSIPFSEADRWDASSPQKLVRELQLLKRIREGNLPNPISLSIEREEPLLNGVNGTLIDSGIRTALAALPGLIDISDTGSDDQFGIIQLTNEKTSISFAGIMGFVFDFDKDTPRGNTPGNYANDVLVCLVVALVRIGEPNVAKRLLSIGAFESVLVTIPVFGCSLAKYLLDVGFFAEAIECLKILVGTNEQDPLPHILFPHILAASSNFAEPEHKMLEEFLRQRVVDAMTDEDTSRLGVFQYNLGRYLENRNNLCESFMLLKSAAKNEPKYLERSYFSQELAGVLFRRESYFQAAKWYARAVELAEPQEIVSFQPQYADALFHAGCYKQAEENWKTYLDAVEESPAEWCLKLYMAECISEMLSLSQQNRNQRKALAQFPDGLSEDDERYDTAIDSALRFDALCSLAWFNYAARMNTTGEYKNAMNGFLFAALTNTQDVEAWCNAILLSMRPEQNCLSLVAHIVEAAYFYHREKILEQINLNLNMQGPDFPSNEVLKAFDEILSTVRNNPGLSTNRGTLMRVFDDNGKPHLHEVSYP